MPLRCLTLCSIVLLAAAAHLAAGRDFVVATTGDDQAAGTEHAPLKTIRKAVALARAGDTILVRDGVYAEGVRFVESGRQDLPITLKNFPDEHPILQPGEPNRMPRDKGVLLQAREGHEKPIGWIVIEGLEIRCAYDGIKFYNAHDFVIRHCRIRESWNQGLLGAGHRVLIDRNLIEHNGTNPEARDNLLHGIYAGGSDFTVTNNIIHSNRSYGIQVAAYPYKPDTHAAKEYSGARNWRIVNNTLALNRHGGIVIWMADAENCAVQNNIFYRNRGTNGLLFYDQEGKRHSIQSNIFFPPGKNLVAREDGAYDAQDNREVDPRLTDPEGFDFRLTSESPAIDRGKRELARETDFFGMRRPQNAGWDIGAIELSSGE